MYTLSELEYQKTWNTIFKIYNLIYLKSISFLYKTYITDIYYHFVKYYTNEVLNINISVTFYSEDAYLIILQ